MVVAGVAQNEAFSPGGSLELELLRRGNVSLVLMMLSKNPIFWEERYGYRESVVWYYAP